jgi:hypothetical protein
MPVGCPARRLADMSSRIYGQQADPIIGYCPALTHLLRTSLAL